MSKINVLTKKIVKYFLIVLKHLISFPENIYQYLYQGTEYTCWLKYNKTHICVNNLAYVEHGTHLPV